MALDERARLRQPGGGLSLVVLDDQLHRPPGELAAVLVEEQLHAVDHVLAVRGEAAGETDEHAHLDRALLGPRRRARRDQRDGNDHGEHREGDPSHVRANLNIR